MKLDEIVVRQRLIGLASGEPALVLAVDGFDDSSVQVTFETAGGRLGQRILSVEEAHLITPSPVETRPFDADGEDFKLAAELLRIQWAAVHDPMLAVSSSRIDPLPHQLRAVYGEMLPRTPLRFCLADDPGAGKTVMAGLYIKELMLRGDLARCLIIAPGGLVEQWQDELHFKFGLDFALLTSEAIDSAYDLSPFQKNPLLIARMDQLARNDELLEMLSSSEWDLVVVDEAHRMSAHRFGVEVKRSRRYELGERLSPIARHLLLMTATPHAGIEDSFQLFMALLDPDRFEGAFTHGLSSRDTTGLMRRMVKEELLTFEGTPLFPERVAATVPYELSPQEVDLYEEVTAYVRNEMNRADRLGGTRKNTVGFALTVLQRRLASSPEAIYRSLVRRLERLQKRRQDLVNGLDATIQTSPSPAVIGDYDTDEFSSAEAEELEDELVDAATAAQTLEELETELRALERLVEIARRVRNLDEDKKWIELRGILQDEGLLTAGDGTHRKLIIFTEHRDTLEYLRHKITTALGQGEAVQAIHGGVRREERRRTTEEFTHNPDCRILLATDAAGEGLNLQAAHLMVNYDLPWNPNRIEQRFGRIHRIGQTEVCRLWNLVATNTREGDVFTRLLQKIEEQRQAYGGKVFDVLGQSFTQTSLKDLLIDAIRYGDQPEVRDRMNQVINASVGEGITELLTTQALAHDALPPAQLAELRRQMNEARARKLQPHFIEGAFRAALERAGGRWSRRETGRFEITRVPATVVQRAPSAVASRYERVTCEPDLVELPDKPRAVLIEPSHPLYRAVTEQALVACGDVLTRGALLWSEYLDEPAVLAGLELHVLDGTQNVIGKRVHYVWVHQDGSVEDAGPAPYLDLGTCRHTAASQIIQQAPWVPNAEEKALAWAVRDGRHLLGEVTRIRGAEIAKTRELVETRLKTEIHRLDVRAMQVADDARRGKHTSKGEAASTLAAQAERLQARLAARLDLLDREAHFTLQPPRTLTTALVIPPDMVDPGDLGPRSLPRETAASERRGVDAVLAAEHALGRHPVEQHHSNPGFDILSASPDGRPVWIEVKARVDGAEDFVVTRTEVLHAKNTGNDHRLAMVRLSPEGPQHDEVRYLANHFARVEEGDLSMRAVVLNWADEWAKGSSPF